MPPILRPGETLLDVEALDRLRQTMRHPAAFQDLLREFLASSNQLMAILKGPQVPGSRDIERAAHTLKSMARLVGANELAERCRVVEFAAHGPRADPAPPRAIAAIASQLRKTQEALERLLT